MTDSTPPDRGRFPVPPGGAVGSSNGGTRVNPKRPRGGRRRAKRKHFILRHKILVSLATVFLLLGGTAGGYLWWLNDQIGHIDRVNAGIKEIGKNESSEPLNILLLGADKGTNGETIAQELKDGKWTPGAFRSDTMMVVHIPADHKSVQLVSIPRDTWVKIHGYPYNGGFAKINAAFSYGGPEMATDTVEKLTGIRMDHLAIIDWEGFRGLTSALGGVRVYIPETFYDYKQDVTWEKGWTELEGEQALQYVRTRHGLTNGDFDRIKRQQNFLRATMGQALSKGTTRNPIRLGKVVGVITDYLTVDDTWGNGEIRNLALSMRKIHTSDVQFLTAPFGSYDTSPDGQSIVRLAPKKTQALFAAIKKDDIASYLHKHPDEALANNKSID